MLICPNQSKLYLHHQNRKPMLKKTKTKNIKTHATKKKKNNKKHKSITEKTKTAKKSKPKRKKNKQKWKKQTEKRLNLYLKPKRNWRQSLQFQNLQFTVPYHSHGWLCFQYFGFHWDNLLTNNIQYPFLKKALKFF